MILRVAGEMEINEMAISPTVPWSVIPQWLLPQPKVDMSLLEKRDKDQGDGYNARMVQTYIQSHYFSYVLIYSDASKNIENRVGVAFTVIDFNVKVNKRISDNLSVYTGEMIAVLLALQWVEENRPLRTLICSDSSSSLMSLESGQSESRSDVLIEILQTLYRIQMMGLEVSFCWVPAHIGVKGNELADECAKEATGKSDIDIKVNYSKAEMKFLIKQHVKNRWQKQWVDERTGRWLYNIQRIVGKGRITRRNRKEESIISRLRFGHTALNSTLNKIGKHQTGACEYCNQEETVEHVIMKCPKYNSERRVLIFNLKRIKMKFNLTNLLQRNSHEECIDFLLLYLKMTDLDKRL
ncbi:uncharacterized protein LOC125247880 [Megalobrama amblycephala]|uniref:uncharacterized protein LOC125247880 n=1 Tax=Megalobrama amblycephala TaxID=75352 RepID=UPI002013F5CD|nr:uncharacterized protein LOC125247880 [Megalobrama amblycephala]